MRDFADKGALCLQAAKEISIITLDELALCGCPTNVLTMTHRLLRIVRRVGFEIYCGCEDCITIASNYIDDAITNETPTIVGGLHVPSSCPSSRQGGTYGHVN